VTSQPGWHPDPVPPRPGQPAQLRYWDGTRWTEHTAPAQPPAASDHYAAPAYQGQYAAAPSDPAAYAATYAAAYAYSGPPSTPDGVPLAGWWWRVLALVIDWMIVDGAQAAQQFGDRLLESPRSFADRTSISAGIDFSMAQLARAVERSDEAGEYEARYRNARAAFQQQLFDPARGLFRDRGIEGRVWQIVFRKSRAREGLDPQVEVERRGRKCAGRC